MSETRVRYIERRIGRIKEALATIGPMRPGSLTRQYKDPKGKSGAYWQISYTRAMKSHTAYVRQECVADIRRQITAHKRFKTLTEQWIDVSIEASTLNMQIAKKVGSA
ncbi:MAG: hypothetical protein IMZ65_02500 [Planctomycetes bacterium]|nr:hypothetical protein [Planctomycetota bacterium]